MRATERQLHNAMRFTSLGMFDMNVQTGYGQFVPSMLRFSVSHKTTLITLKSFGISFE